MRPLRVGRPPTLARCQPGAGSECSGCCSDAKAFVRELDAQVVTGSYLDPRCVQLTLAEFAEQWIDVNRPTSPRPDRQRTESPDIPGRFIGERRSGEPACWRDVGDAVAVAERTAAAGVDGIPASGIGSERFGRAVQAKGSWLSLDVQEGRTGGVQLCGAQVPVDGRHHLKVVVLWTVRLQELEAQAL